MSGLEENLRKILDMVIADIDDGLDSDDVAKKTKAILSRAFKDLNERDTKTLVDALTLNYHPEIELYDYEVSNTIQKCIDDYKRPAMLRKFGMPRFLDAFFEQGGRSYRHMVDFYPRVILYPLLFVASVLGIVGAGAASVVAAAIFVVKWTFSTVIQALRYVVTDGNYETQLQALRKNLSEADYLWEKNILQSIIDKKIKVLENLQGLDKDLNVNKTSKLDSKINSLRSMSLDQLKNEPEVLSELNKHYEHNFIKVKAAARAWYHTIIKPLPQSLLGKIGHIIKRLVQAVLGLLVLPLLVVEFAVDYVGMYLYGVACSILLLPSLLFVGIMLIPTYFASNSASPSSDVTTGASNSAAPYSDVTTGASNSAVPSSDVTTGANNSEAPFGDVRTGAKSLDSPDKWDLLKNEAREILDEMRNNNPVYKKRFHADLDTKKIDDNRGGNNTPMAP